MPLSWGESPSSLSMTQLVPSKLTVSQERGGVGWWPSNSNGLQGWLGLEKESQAILPKAMCHIRTACV